jgi:hypothetical protein
MMSAGAAMTTANGNESDQVVRAWWPSGIQVDLFQPTTANQSGAELGVERSTGAYFCKGS